MIVLSLAPSRISLFGSGTDLLTYQNGLVINLAINIRTKTVLFTGDDMYSRLRNEFPYAANPEFYFHIAKQFGLDGMHSFKIDSEFLGNIRSGLGSSGSAVVCMVSGISKLKGLNLTREEIAEKAFEIENQLWVTGRQDVYASAFGGMNIWEFGDKVKRYEVQPRVAENLKKHIFLYYIGGEKKPQVSKLSNLDEIKNIASEALTCLEHPDQVGRLLNDSWQLKKKSNPNVSDDRIDKIYSDALNKGVWGGKVCGSGGAGYMVFMSEEKPKLDLEEVDFSIDYQGVESRII